MATQTLATQNQAAPRWFCARVKKKILSYYPGQYVFCRKRDDGQVTVFTGSHHNMPRTLTQEEARSALELTSKCDEARDAEITYQLDWALSH